MQNDKDHPSIAPDPPRDSSTKKPSDVPMPDDRDADALLKKTGNSQGQSKGRPQSQPQE